MEKSQGEEIMKEGDIIGEEIKKKEIKITKQKNQKRVEAGKKLVEWNKKNKEKREREKRERINQAMEIDSADSNIGGSTDIGKINTSSYLFIGGVISIGVVGFILYFKSNNNNKNNNNNIVSTNSVVRNDTTDMD